MLFIGKKFNAVDPKIINQYVSVVVIGNLM